MLRTLAHLLYPRGATRTVLRGCRRGCRFVVRDAMGVHFSLGHADEEQFAHRLKELVRPGDAVLDVGANRGQWALLFAGLVGPQGRVISVEPMPELVVDLRRNCELNGFSNVTVVEAAAADRFGETTFSFSEARQTQGKMTSVEPSYVVENSRSVTVRTETLDNIIRQYGVEPSFVKIDVEGAAAVALAGASEMLRHRPVMYLELHGPEEVDAARRLISEFGYRLETTAGEPVPDPGHYSGGPLFCFPT